MFRSRRGRSSSWPLLHIEELQLKAIESSSTHGLRQNIFIFLRKQLNKMNDIDVHVANTCEALQCRHTINPLPPPSYCASQDSTQAMMQTKPPAKRWSLSTTYDLHPQCTCRPTALLLVPVLERKLRWSSAYSCCAYSGVSPTTPAHITREKSECNELHEITICSIEDGLSLQWSWKL